MAKVTARIEVSGPISEAEALWYDPARWPAFVEGFAHIIKKEGDWPKQDARVVWDSVRDGRGRVVERVRRYEARVGQTVEVEDPKLHGTQAIAFEALTDPPRTAIKLELQYKLKGTTFGGPIVDVLFVRRALGDSLRKTLMRFRRELEADREFTGGSTPPAPR
jgi:uncharacterized membrane protein